MTLKTTRFVRRFAPPRDSDSLLLFDYYKRIKKKMSVGKSLVSKCHQARFPFGRDLPSFRRPASILDFFRFFSSALRSPAASTSKLSATITSPTGHEKFRVAYHWVPMDLLFQSSILDPILKAPSS